MSRRSKRLTKQRIGNAQVSGSGAGGAGDRTAPQYTAQSSQNPYFNNNFLARYQAYALLYYTSWEAQKIINIPVDDALREPFKLVGLDENDSKLVMAAYDDMNCLDRIRRALYQERMLGGSVILMGVRQDAGAKASDPLDYSRVDTGGLRFVNTVSIDRISRGNYCTDPFDSRYDSPTSYLVGGIDTDVSRMLVFDGSPLFSRDSATIIQQYRVNPAGFGESKLAALFDILVRTTGTQQGAYQLVNLASVLLAQCDNLIDLQGGSAEDTLREVMNQISIYRAAILKGKGMQVTQHSATFGSVPELVMTFAQLLSAASDIPATRFLGQAPGGLNATGDSDLENYYNHIASYQKISLKRQLTKLFDVLIPSVIGQQKWAGLRDRFDIEFAPLWNMKATEQATVDNTYCEMIKGLYAEAIISQEQAINELKARGIFKTEIEMVEFLEKPGEEDDDAAGALDLLKEAA